MEHFEFMYLMHRANMMRKYIEKAEADGEMFHVSDSFVPLQCGVSAQVQIRKINPEDAKPSAILRVRHRPKKEDGGAIALKAAQGFFSKEFTAMPAPVEHEHWIEHVFFSSEIPAPPELEKSSKKSRATG
jgi:hypothetical protein